jgi:hypothetical protein
MARGREHSLRPRAVALSAWRPPGTCGTSTDLTSPYIESDPLFCEVDNRWFDCTWAKRLECARGVGALIVTLDGLWPNEILTGNVFGKMVRKTLFAKIRSPYAKARRIWVMNAGILKETM